MTRDIIFHLPKDWLDTSGEGVMPFYDRLRNGLEAEGRRVHLRPLDKSRVAAQAGADDAIHLVNHGRIRHPRVWNAGIAYVYPFWNVDPWGIRAFSSIAGLRFDPDRVDAEAARPFFRRLRKRLVGARSSRYPQPGAVEALPEGAVAVFLQSEAHRDVEETCHLTREQMVETVLEAAQGPVVVKSHPRDTDPATAAWLRRLAARHCRLTVSGGNIHDILAACERVVTINSAVGIEACLHRKPVVLCGQADFHHLAKVAKTPEELAEALGGRPRKRAYDKYVYWYFGLQCLSTTDPALARRFLERVEAGL
ncbi:capsular polysaccharide export protein, LipB/KpsS family [Marinibacterium profundimaris]|uniref:Capsule polysaccharide biosynthesis protein n=1 Tax=Marinibacterium profundimaris TaxID=1679460 RepID=A0A225NHM2_9RHOB|nr:hypothetical protein [Marinibacterium profundimaris]OWU69873.1 hypothetical protein ATO3_21645 [Marinibacterium profundimaris]